MKLKTLGMAAAVLLIGFGAAQADILIENYDCPVGFTSLTNSTHGSTINMVTAVPCALGGTREKQISIIRGGSNNPPADTLAARASVGFGAFAASTDTGVIVSSAAQAGGTFTHGISTLGPGATPPLLGDIDRIDLRFHSGSGNEIDLVLNNFNAAVAEPSTIVLMGAGFAGLGLVRFVRRARKS